MEGCGSMARVLVVDDEAAIRELIQMHLCLVGHTALLAEDAYSAEAELNKGADIALLDIMLPGRDGFALAQKCFEAGVPVIFLTAKTAVSDRVRGLKMGADDYILKPFEPAEVLARIDAVLRRTGRQQETYQDKRLRVDFSARQVFMDGQLLTLTAQEYDLLRTLISQRNIALSREQLLRLAWGYDYMGETRTVDVHIQRLRRKLNDGCIETVYKFGYRFTPMGREAS
jgi:two-component system, OmpR family, alkaline phosphatase synthesis response regulator PhoP